jgi:NADH-quinone oxidoreductase subunit H
MPRRNKTWKMHDFYFWPTLITILVVFGTIQGTAGFLVYVERKICAYMQNRHGPNRVGPMGLFQSIADAAKFILKEDIVPSSVDKPIFILAPCIAVGTAMLSFAVVPFGATGNPGAEGYRSTYQFVIAPGIDIGILFIFAVSSLAVYGIILGGWASNNKYSLLGGLRSSAQIISYEIPLGLSIVGVVLMTGSLNLESIIWKQAEAGILGWNIWYQPLAFLLFMISALAECNRLPFDLPETEQELVGGYHTEYNAWKLACFFLGEYAHMVTISFLMVILFFGGWHFPFLAPAGGNWLLQLIVFAGKVTLFILFFMLIRWTIPRFRFDQLMGLAWKVLIPLALVNLVAVMVVKEFFGTALWVLAPVTLGALVVAALITTAPTPRKDSPLAA